MSQTKKLYYNVREVVQLLGLSRSTIYSMIKRGEIKSHTVRRRRVFRASDIESM